MSEHGLQAAYFAQRSGATEALCVAALLHDIGHLTESVPDDICGVDQGRRSRAQRQPLAGDDTSGPKSPSRCDCTCRPSVTCAPLSPPTSSELSAASVATLKLQGGPMSTEEIAAFESEPYWRDAVRVRRWDDQGKVAGLKTPDFEHYRESD